MFHRMKRGKRYLLERFATVVGVVLVWRGVWIMFDLFDQAIFGGISAKTALLSVALGLLFLYLPRKDFRSIDKL